MWGQTKSIAEIKAKIAEIRTTAAEHDVDDETLEGLYPQLLQDIDRAQERLAEDNERQRKRNAFWDAREAAQLVKASPAVQALKAQQDELEARLEATGKPVADHRQRALDAEDVKVERKRKQKWKAWHEANQQQNVERVALRNQFWLDRSTKHGDEDTARTKERADNWAKLAIARQVEDNHYKLAVARLKRAHRTTFFKDFSHGCNNIFYRNIQSGYRHTAEFFATTGRTISRAGTWVAAHARECFETVTTGLHRAAVASGKFIAECASTTKRTASRATTAPFHRMGDSIVTAAIAAKRKFQDLNPIAAYDRQVEEDMLMNVDQDIIEQTDGENIGQRFGLFKPAPVVAAAAAPRVLPPPPAPLHPAPAPVAAAAAPGYDDEDLGIARLFGRI